MDIMSRLPKPMASTTPLMITAPNFNCSVKISIFNLADILLATKITKMDQYLFFKTLQSVGGNTGAK